ncbi:MAG: fibro-slime domain-containing protein, partial [Phycisphaerales bacterium]|nr:fibro-slime domain-containing protein [Phycisphaerales bacterium]
MSRAPQPHLAPGLVLLAGLALALPASAPAASGGAGAGRGDRIVLTGIVRDFREVSEYRGHPDFERYPCRGAGHYVKIVDDLLDDEGKPTFRTSGCLVRVEPTDALGRSIIIPKDYIETYSGDAPGAWDCFGDHEDDGEYQGPVSVTGQVNLNPNNNPDHEFALRLPDASTITRDDLHATFEGYDGEAQYAFFRPKGNGNQNGLVFDGVAYELRNGAQYELSAASMHVRIYNDKMRNGRAMGHWWMEVVSASNASLWSSYSNDDQDHSYAHSDYGDSHVCNSVYPGGGAVYSPTSLASWYRDIIGVNVAKNVSISLVRDPDTGVYVFDDRTDPEYAPRGGFFPIDNELYGNSPESAHNFHFTYEVRAKFTHKEDSGRYFTFEGDDDVWLFIDGRLVLDVGGIHGPVAQTIEIDRLTWLEDGKDYELAFFF